MSATSANTENSTPTSVLLPPRATTCSDITGVSP
jgi:hypothetical protein